jgi:hypothetical protein
LQNCAEAYSTSSGILATRAAVEVTAALCYLNACIRDVLKSGSIGDIDECLMRRGCVSRIDPTAPNAINVLTFVDKESEEVREFRQQYEDLSEFAHPNWTGTALLYSKSDRENMIQDFGQKLRHAENAKQIGITNLSLALLIFEKSYKEIGKAISALVGGFDR